MTGTFEETISHTKRMKKVTFKPLMTVTTNKVVIRDGLKTSRKGNFSWLNTLPGRYGYCGGYRVPYGLATFFFDPWRKEGLQPRKRAPSRMGFGGPLTVDVMPSATWQTPLTHRYRR